MITKKTWIGISLLLLATSVAAMADPFLNGVTSISNDAVIATQAVGVLMFIFGAGWAYFTGARGLMMLGELLFSVVLIVAAPAIVPWLQQVFR